MHSITICLVSTVCQVPFSGLQIQLQIKSNEVSALVEVTFCCSRSSLGWAHVFNAVNRAHFVSNVYYPLGRPQVERKE